MKYGTVRFWLSLIAVMVAGGNAFTQTGPLIDTGLLDGIRVVEDPEGQVNVRSGASLESSVQRKLASGSVISVSEREGDWFVVFDGRENGASEFIHASRLKEVSGWAQMGVKDNQGILKHRGFEARVTSSPFIAQDHETVKLADGLYEVDGAVPWGTDGGLPNQSLALSVTVNGAEVVIPEEATEGLYEPNFETMVLLTPGDPAGQAILFMLNSDGAGAYGVFWAFAKGRYLSRTVIPLS